MVRVLTGVAAWLGGTALAVGLAWFGAGLVVRNTGMTPSPPAISAGALPGPASAPASPQASAGRDPGPRATAGRPRATPSAPATASPAATTRAGGGLAVPIAGPISANQAAKKNAIDMVEKSITTAQQVQFGERQDDGYPDSPAITARQ